MIKMRLVGDWSSIQMCTGIPDQKWTFYFKKMSGLQMVILFNLKTYDYWTPHVSGIQILQVFGLLL